ncbi:lipocalin-like domain-containing protein [Limimaricola variabilis]
MNVRLFILLALPATAQAQGFAGLGGTAGEFALPEPDTVLSFPADHGAHPAYRIEWWYLTANLTDPDGTPYGLQWTLFRSALAPREGDGWESPQLWLGHAAVTTADTHLFTERLARGGIGQAGVTVTPFEAWIDDWQMAGERFEALSLAASGPDFAYDMTLKARGPLVLHGDEGYSVKSAEGQASYYYSQPFFDIAGTLTLPEGAVELTGSAWFDHEWSSQPLSERQTGWDWFSLSFEGGAKLMGFRLREGEDEGYTYASWIAPDGRLTPYVGSFAAEPLETTRLGAVELPVRWAVRLPEEGVEIEVEALNAAAWNALTPPYWEGPVVVTGSHQGQGYLEMTGYE